MLKEDNIKKELSAFALNVISESKRNLRNKTTTRKLKESLGFDIKVSKNSFQLNISMEDYGKYQDKGVSGIKRKYNTPFSYKSKGGKRGLKGMPPPSKFDKWTVRKGIAARDEKGRFLTRKQTNFLIAKSVFEKGIKPSFFFTRPFKKYFRRLPEQLTEKYALDVENFLEFTLK